MATGITTSETMAGEQPKDDNLGSRVDKLETKIDKLKKDFAVFRRMSLDKTIALEKKIEEKNNDE